MSDEMPFYGLVLLAVVAVVQIIAILIRGNI